MTRIVLISGSTRDGSLHTAALRTAARHAPPDVATILYDGLRTLPAYVPGATSPSAAVMLLKHCVETSHALLFATPEYAGSLPGSLKNLLDWLVDARALDGKPAAWLSVSPPGRDDGARATLETALDHGNAQLLRSACIRVPLGPGAVDGQGLIGDPQLHRALQDMLPALARSAAPPHQRQEPSWQAYSSVYPMVMRRPPEGRHHRR
ncbi:NADPH-dependent FMN reductase [Spirilliplanes yamanashiensis]|uniref:NADPH-dependent FMN reductase-like domain-containing protein n=1 Tax=Spirilliplanes yamanashiensis TaxID=42233 RepID=A0A8J3YF00_9ACTN|nr:NADPH-dependent FMN reductase [Spirilliplanes yamanashiensis]MDP9815264.1 hypothetical protein [Spirilliplanes yamanashiensis]GIJ06467.1 hypothetical protein Sya03_58190 [Spirilliplanes yamanashiensis]